MGNIGYFRFSDDGEDSEDEPDTMSYADSFLADAGVDCNDNVGGLPSYLIEGGNIQFRPWPQVDVLETSAGPELSVDTGTNERLCRT